jgi:hypothetical protein
LSIGLLVGMAAVVFFGFAWFNGAIDRNKFAMLSRKSAQEK